MRGNLKLRQKSLIAFELKISKYLHYKLVLTPFRGRSYTIFEKLLLLCKNFFHNIYTLTSNLHLLWNPNLKLYSEVTYTFWEKKNHQIYTFFLSLHLFVKILTLFLKSYSFCVRIFGITFILFIPTYTFCERVYKHKRSKCYDKNSYTKGVHFQKWCKYVPKKV